MATNLSSKLKNISPNIVELISEAPYLRVNQLVATKNIISSITPVSVASIGTGPVVLTGAQVKSGYITLAGATTSFNVTLPTYQSLVDNGLQSGNEVTFLVNNGSTQVATVKGSTGTTIVGSDATVAASMGAQIVLVLNSTSSAVAFPSITL